MITYVIVPIAPAWECILSIAWTDICSCNICIHYILVDYAGGRVMQGAITETLCVMGRGSVLV